MDAAAGLLLMLLGVCTGVETSCDGRQNGTQCFGALGGTVFIQLMNNTSEIHKFQLQKNNLILLNVKIDKQSITSEDRYQFSCNNGTFRINQLSRTDSGKYKLEMFKPDGKTVGTRTLQLSVQAPVSSVQLVPQCLSQGQMKVSCSSEGGDSPQYSWTLDGHTLTDSELLSVNNGTNIIVLSQNISGHLICSVRNNISESSEGTHISPCGSVLLPVLSGVLSVCVLFLVVFTTVLCAKKKKENNKAVEEDDQEPTYNNIRIVKQGGRRVEQNVEEEVEYGQVKVSKRPHQSDEVADDSLYAKVKKPG